MGKRGNGEGSVYPRSDGRWVASVTLENGKRRDLYAKTRKDAVAKRKQFQRDQLRGVPVLSERLTVAAFLTGWLATKKPRLTVGTYERYEQYVNLHLVPALGTTILAKLTPEQLSDLYAVKVKTLAPQTVQHMHRVLHTALEYAVKTQKVVRNVADVAEPPRVPHHEMKYLSRDQARRFMDAVAGDRLESLFMLAITTGMRRGELLALRWAAVDLDGAVTGTPTLYVHSSVRRAKSGGGFVFGEPKTKGSRRRVDLHTGVVAVLRRHRTAQNEERLRLGAIWEDNDLVFANELGRPIEGGNLLRRNFRPLLTRAGLPAVRFHDLRHTAVTIMIERGVDLLTIARVVGHRDATLIQQRYGHVTDTMQARAVAAMDTLFAV